TTSRLLTETAQPPMPSTRTAITKPMMSPRDMAGMIIYLPPIVRAAGGRGAPAAGRGTLYKSVKEAFTDSPEPLPEYHVKARNTSPSSENKIHDEHIARQYGFRGALVPGVTVYASLTHPLVEAFGAAWLERGTANVR